MHISVKFDVTTIKQHSDILTNFNDLGTSDQQNCYSFSLIAIILEKLKSKVIKAIAKFYDSIFS